MRPVWDAVVAPIRLFAPVMSSFQVFREHKAQRLLIVVILLALYLKDEMNLHKYRQYGIEGGAGKKQVISPLRRSDDSQAHI